MMGLLRDKGLYRDSPEVAMKKDLEQLDNAALTNAQINSATIDNASLTGAVGLPAASSITVNNTVESPPTLDHLLKNLSGTESAPLNLPAADHIIVNNAVAENETAPTLASLLSSSGTTIDSTTNLTVNSLYAVPGSVAASQITADQFNSQGQDIYFNFGSGGMRLRCAKAGQFKFFRFLGMSGGVGGPYAQLQSYANGAIDFSTTGTVASPYGNFSSWVQVGSHFRAKNNSATARYEMYLYHNQYAKWHPFHGSSSGGNYHGYKFSIDSIDFLNAYRYVNGSQAYQLYQVAYNFSYSSDDRLKFNETPITQALDAIRLLNPVTYDMSRKIVKTSTTDEGEEIETVQWPTASSGSTPRSGFIAQEVFNIPALRHTARQGNETMEWSLFYEDIFTHAVAAIQELDTVVRAQAATIAALEQRISSLEQKI